MPSAVEDSDLEPTEPLLGKLSGEGKSGGQLAPRAYLDAFLLFVLVGGTYMFGSVPSTLIVFTGPKMAAHRHGFNQRGVSLCQTLFWVGFAASSLLLLPRLDGLGRLRPVRALVATGLAAAAVSCGHISLWVYGACTFVIGCTLTSAGLLAALCLMESLPVPLRPRAMVCLNVGYGLVVLAMSCIAARAEGLSWRAETLLWYSPFLAMLVLGSAFVRERPHSGGGEDVAMRASSTDGFLKVWSQPFRATMAITVLCWASTSVTYYGLSYAAGRLSPSLYWNMALLSAVDIVGLMLPAPIVARLGCTATQSASFLGAGIFLIVCSALPTGSRAALVCALLGRLCIDVASTTIYLLLVECFPLDCRASAMGMANFFGRLLSLMSPLCTMIPPKIVYSVLGAVAIAASVLTKVGLKTLPEL